MKTCSTCKFFFKLENQCRINPPTVAMVSSPRGDLQALGTFPPTRENQWCGKHAEDIISENNYTEGAN